MKNKETIIYVMNAENDDGYTRRSLNFLDILAKKYNIILLFDNLNVNINDYINNETKKSIVFKKHFQFNIDRTVEIIKNKFNWNDLKITNKFSQYDFELINATKNLIKENNVKKVYWYFWAYWTPFALKAFSKDLKIISILDYFVNINNYLIKNKWLSTINEHSDYILYRNIHLKHLITNKNKKYLPLTVDFKSYLENGEKAIWSCDEKLFKTSNLKIGFANYFDHNANGLWDLIPLHKNLIDNDVIYDFYILGRSPIFWGEYEEKFMKFHEESFNKYLHILGWRSNVMPYLKQMDIIISNTQFYENSLKISQTLFEAILSEKVVITTNYFEFEELKEFGVVYAGMDKLNEFLKENQNNLITMQTNKDKLINKLKENSEFVNKFINTMEVK